MNNEINLFETLGEAFRPHQSRIDVTSNIIAQIEEKRQNEREERFEIEFEEEGGFYWFDIKLTDTTETSQVDSDSQPEITSGSVDVEIIDEQVLNEDGDTYLEAYTYDEKEIYRFLNGY